ncbi:hypothetical protein EAO77_02035 [Streptomyces sp. t39]|nr:hypothetical protein EAO77_02035 [Streptomyces sp. t39]
MRPDDGPAAGTYGTPTGEDAYGSPGTFGASAPYGADTGATAPYGTGASATSPYGTSPYGSSASDPFTGPVPDGAPYGPDAYGGPSGGFPYTASPYPPGAAQDGPAPAPDTLFRPPSAGEPWNAPAGDRP